MSPVLGKKTLLEIRTYLDPRSRLVKAIDAALKPKRAVRAAKARRVAKQKTRRSEMDQIRDQVAKRAHGCEACGTVKDGLQVDHMFGGNGRRVSLQSKFTCWALCWACHHQKTNNAPSAEHWLREFAEHCERQCKFSGCGGATCEGYARAAEIAQARIDSLALQNRTGGAP